MTFRGVLATLLTLLATAGGAVAQSGPSIPDAGVRIEPGPPGDLCRDARLAAAAGFEWVSTGAYWEAMEPTPKAYTTPGSAAAARWADLESLLSCIRDLGMRPLVVITDAPGWASGRTGVTDDFPTAANTTAYAEFLQDFTRRYATYLGALAPWNEPNFAWFWAFPHDPVRYAQMQRAAYTAIKSVAPALTVTSAPVVGSAGTSATAAWDYIEDLYAAGFAGTYDVFAFNFYPRQEPEAEATDTRGRPAPWALSSQTYLRSLIDRHDPGKPVWITEVGNSTCVSCNSSPANALNEQNQSDYLVRTYTYRRRYLQGVTERIFWFNLRDLSTSRSDWLGNMGLVRFDLTPKPAYTALSQLRVTNPPDAGGKITTPAVPLPAVPRSATNTPVPSSGALKGVRTTLSRPTVTSRRGKITLAVRANVSRGKAVLRIEGYLNRRWRPVKTLTLPGSARLRVTLPDRGYLALRVYLKPVGAKRWTAARVVKVPVAGRR